MTWIFSNAAVRISNLARLRQHDLKKCWNLSPRVNTVIIQQDIMVKLPSTENLKLIYCVCILLFQLEWQKINVRNQLLHVRQTLKVCHCIPMLLLSLIKAGHLQTSRVSYSTYTSEIMRYRMTIKRQTDFLWVEHISYFRILVKESGVGKSGPEEILNLI